MTRFVEKGVKYVKFDSNSFHMDHSANYGPFGLPIRNEKKKRPKKTALIYRSQVREDEDWYEILNWRTDNDRIIDSMVALGDDYKKKFYQK